MNYDINATYQPSDKNRWCGSIIHARYSGFGALIIINPLKLPTTLKVCSHFRHKVVKEAKKMIFHHE